MTVAGRHRRRHRGLRRAAAPAAAAGAVLLAATVAMAAPPSPVAGTPSPVALESGNRALIGAKPTPRAAPTTEAPHPAAPPAASPAATPEARPAQPDNTVRLARGGTATLVPMEVVNGVLPVPEGVRQAAWWGAALDASTGATVLAGHVNWHGATGPFAELWQAAVGDTVTVVDKDGRVYRFQVRQLVTVHKDQLPGRAQELFGQDGGHRLALVTCGGRWVGGHDGYEENRVVIAEPV
ncbi:class F sortase [Actinophytocola sp.]|uniref:class F sortase n=1 Tax=Actinophytocola sp. TaxID=1872138 RepID=UPI003899F57A